MRCIYKIISTIIEGSLREVLQNIRDIKESILLEGRGLLNGVMVANTVIEEIKKKMNEGTIIKVDFDKAYDTIKRVKISFRKIGVPRKSSNLRKRLDKEI